MDYTIRTLQGGKWLTIPQKDVGATSNRPCNRRNSLMYVQADSILTAKEVAAELRCSKAQVYRLMNGAVPSVRPIPTLPLGRKKVVMRSSLEAWKLANEQNRVIVGGDSEDSAVDASL
jgi:predicted DNA-binding transcriptional regulator AlpA